MQLNVQCHLGAGDESSLGVQHLQCSMKSLCAQLDVKQLLAIVLFLESDKSELALFILSWLSHTTWHQVWCSQSQDEIISDSEQLPTQNHFLRCQPISSSNHKVKKNMFLGGTIAVAAVLTLPQSMTPGRWTQCGAWALEMSLIRPVFFQIFGRWTI